MGSDVTAPGRRVRWGRSAYVAVAGVFACCVVVQVFVAGMGVFVDPANWTLHRTVAHLAEPLVLLLLVLGFVGDLPQELKLAPLALFLLFSVQYATAAFAGSMVAALHPVSGFAICLLAVWAVSRAWSVVSASRVRGTR